MVGLAASALHIAPTTVDGFEEGLPWQMDIAPQSALHRCCAQKTLLFHHPPDWSICDACLLSGRPRHVWPDSSSSAVRKLSERLLSPSLPPLPPAPPPLPPAQPAQQVTTITDLRSQLASQTLHIELAAGHYLLGGTQLSISSDVTIRAASGSTVILDAGGASRVFYIASGTVTLIGLSITGGYTTVSIPKPVKPPQGPLDCHHTDM